MQVPAIRARFDAVGHVLVDSPGGTIVDVGPRGFATLAPLRGRSPSGMRSRGSKPMSAAHLPHADDERYQHADRGGRSGCAGHGPGPTRGWADPLEHARMLHDDRRTGDYQSALYEAVRRRGKGGVVLDVAPEAGFLR